MLKAGAVGEDNKQRLILDEILRVEGGRGGRGVLISGRSRREEKGGTQWLSFGRRV